MQENKRLTDHFTLNEFLISQTAARLGIDNSPSPEHEANIVKVAEHLEIVRAQFGPVVVSSGYRSPALNAAVPGSSKTSAHCFGLAADFHVPGVANIEICKWVLHNMPDFDQIIYEFGPAPGGWVHLGLSNGIPRKMPLTAKRGDGKTAYLPGIQDLW